MRSVGVFGAIFDDHGRILCVHQNYGPRNWTTPGGQVEPRESPAAALEREVREETGFVVRVTHLIGVYSKTYADDLVLSFEADTIERRPWTSDDEISDVDFFDRASLPEPMAFNTLTRINDAFDRRIGLVRVFDAESKVSLTLPDRRLVHSDRPSSSSL